MAYPPKKEDGSYYSESEIEKLQSDIKKHLIQSSVNSIHILQEYDVDLNKKCFNGRSPLELLRVALDEGLLSDIDESSLYLLGLKKRPCETLNIGNIELNGLCDISLIVGRLENQARRNEKISKNYDLKLIEHIYGNTEGQCTITMFDKILSYKKEVFARDVEVYLNGSEKLGGTNNLELTNFFEELKKDFPSKEQ